MSKVYPSLEINLDKLRSNIRAVKEKCDACGISIAGVVKGVWADPRIAAVYDGERLRHIADSRIEHLRSMKEQGIKTPLMLIRSSMLSETDEVVRYADISLESDITAIRKLEESAAAQRVRHGVILMYDIGDLREGFWEEAELINAALLIENELPHLDLLGVGTNIGCYGALEATPKKLSELVTAAERVESMIGRRLKYISGGATGSFPRVTDGTMPERINHLRLGETLLLCRDQQVLRGYTMPYMHTDIFTLKAEIIEIRQKPSYPQGEHVLDSFGNRPVFEDKGDMKRALLAVGQADYGGWKYGETAAIIPRDKDAEILGASSDHTIIDVTASERDYRTGDIMEFDLWYSSMLHLTCKNGVRKVYKGDKSPKD